MKILTLKNVSYYGVAVGLKTVSQAGGVTVFIPAGKEITIMESQTTGDVLSKITNKILVVTKTENSTSSSVCLPKRKVIDPPVETEDTKKAKSYKRNRR